MRFADDHGIEAGGHAEKVMDGIAAIVAVEVGRNGRESHVRVGARNEGVNDGLRVRLVVGGEGDFHAVAGGEDEGFDNARAGFEIEKSGGQRFGAEGEPLPHLNGRGLVTQSRQVQLHGFSRRAPRPVCAAQVIMEKPNTVTVMMAALRPRQPAEMRRQTRTI